MNLFRRKPAPPAPAIKPPAAAGFFSTHHALRSNETENMMAAHDRIEKSIQRSIKDAKIIDSNGNEISADGTAVAMDEAYPDLQLVKWQNSNGGGIPSTQLLYYGEQSFIGYQTCGILAQHWLIDKVCTMPARDAVRHGYDVTVNDGSEIAPDVLDYIKQRDKDFKVKNNCVELVRMGRIFGIRIVLFEVDTNDPKYYENPFNIDGVKEGSYRGMSQIDPYWITPELDQRAATDPSSRNFYEPTWWRINGKRVHYTHLIVMRNGDELPDILKPTYFYGGIPVPQKIAERVFAAERTANEAPMLALTKRLITLKTDITMVAADPQAFVEKMGFWSRLMNNFGIKVIGQDEEVDQKDTSLADLDAVIMTQYQLVAAAGDVPATKLLGTSPKGFGAAGDYEIESYHELLESMQEHDLSPMVNRHHALLIKSEVCKKFNCSFFQTDIMWRPTDTPTEKEQAEINKLKADTDLALIQGGSIDGTDSRNRIIEERDSGYNGIPAIVPGGPGDREAQQEAEAALEQPVQESNKTKSTESSNAK